VLSRHKGSKSRLAGELGISQSAISVWLAGRMKSARVAAAAEKLAVELMSAESMKANA
jgi:predicted transcriptional regulator